MADYKALDVVGNKWQRAVRVVVDNPYNCLPSILFVEEEIFNTGDTLIPRLCRNLQTTFDSKSELHIEIYTKLNELYVLLREEEDNKILTSYTSQEEILHK